MRLAYLQCWQRFFFAQSAPHALALIRISLGVILLVIWGYYAPHVSMMFSDAGLVLPYWEVQSGSLRMLLTPPALWIAWILYAALLMGALGILFGYRYRLACMITIGLLTYFGLLSYHNLLGTWARLLFFALMVLSMSGADQTLSLHMKKEKGCWKAYTLVPVWPQRIIAIQVAATYLGVSLQKTYLPDWQSGEIIAYTFVNMWSTPLAYAIARWNIPLPLFDAILWAIKILQGLLPIGLWSSRYQKWCFAGGALFHLSIAAIMGMWGFLVIIPLYATFIDPEKMRLIISRAVAK